MDRTRHLKDNLKKKSHSLKKNKLSEEPDISPEYRGNWKKYIRKPIKNVNG